MQQIFYSWTHVDQGMVNRFETSNGVLLWCLVLMVSVGVWWQISLLVIHSVWLFNGCVISERWRCTKLCWRLTRITQTPLTGFPWNLVDELSSTLKKIEQIFLKTKQVGIFRGLVSVSVYKLVDPKKIFSWLLSGNKYKPVTSTSVAKLWRIQRHTNTVSPAAAKSLNCRMVAKLFKLGIGDWFVNKKLHFWIGISKFTTWPEDVTMVEILYIELTY